MDKSKAQKLLKVPRAFKLFARTLRLLAALASRLNLTETAVIELAITRMAQAEGLVDEESK